jgi:uncharacterized protein YrrD
MEIQLGAAAIGTQGKLGAIQGMIVEAHTERATDLVVRHHGLLGRARVVPLAHVTGVEGDTVHLDLDEAGFAALDGFVTDRYHAPSQTFTPTGTSETTFSVDAAVSGGGFGGHLGGLPSGRTWPDDTERAVVSAGTPVIDVTGQRIGAVHAFGITTGGVPSRLVLRRGHVIHHDTAIPLDWVKEIADDGILLRVSASQVAEESRAPRPTADRPAASSAAATTPSARPEVG